MKSFFLGGGEAYGLRAPSLGIWKGTQPYIELYIIYHQHSIPTWNYIASHFT